MVSICGYYSTVYSTVNPAGRSGELHRQSSRYLNGYLETDLRVEHLEEVYHGSLYRKPRKSAVDWVKAVLIYVKNYSERLDLEKKQREPVSSRRADATVDHVFHTGDRRGARRGQKSNEIRYAPRLGPGVQSGCLRFPGAHREVHHRVKLDRV